MSTKINIAPLYHNAQQPLSLGCMNCPERELCGGLQASLGLYDCTAFCQKCEDPGECSFVCHFNTRVFIARVQEVQGFNFDSIPRVKGLSYPRLPRAVPL